MPSFESHVQLNGGIRIGKPSLFSKDKYTDPFCVIDFGPSKMDRPELNGPMVKLFFDSTEDITALANALATLANDFAAFTRDADDTVPIGTEDEAASMPITTVLGGES